jgi:GTP-binding protein
VNFFRFGNELYLADLPGYGFARVAEEVRKGWESLVRSYLEGREPLALCVFLVDGRHEAQENDILLRDYLEEGDFPFVVAATKTDEVSKGALRGRTEALSRALGGADVVPVSSRTGAGLKELWNTIRAAASRVRKGERNDGR